MARRRYERRALREQQRRAARRRRIRILSAAAAVVLLIGGIVAAAIFWLPSDDGKTKANPKTTPSAPATQSANNCVYTRTPGDGHFVGLPSNTPVAHDDKLRATITLTDKRKVQLQLLGSAAPCTVNSFVFLARKGYFNSTPCHRLTTSGIYVLQCGDPTGTGTGGPGYKFANENPNATKYDAGTVAMANAGPGTNGSQFFLVYREGNLGPQYTIFARVLSGLATLQDIAKVGSDNSNGPGDGKPKRPVKIASVVIS